MIYIPLIKSNIYKNINQNLAFIASLIIFGHWIPNSLQFYSLKANRNYGYSSAIRRQSFKALKKESIS